MRIFRVLPLIHGITHSSGVSLLRVCETLDKTEELESWSRDNCIIHPVYQWSLFVITMLTIRPITRIYLFIYLYLYIYIYTQVEKRGVNVKKKDQKSWNASAG